MAIPSSERAEQGGPPNPHFPSGGSSHTSNQGISPTPSRSLVCTSEGGAIHGGVAECKVSDAAPRAAGVRHRTLPISGDGKREGGVVWGDDLAVGLRRGSQGIGRATGGGARAAFVGAASTVTL